MLIPQDYVKDPDEIYRQSFATIWAEAGLSVLPAELQAVAERMVHACGMTGFRRRSPGTMIQERGAGPGEVAHRRTGHHAGWWRSASSAAPWGRARRSARLTIRRADLARRRNHHPRRSDRRAGFGRRDRRPAAVAIGNAPTALSTIDLAGGGRRGRRRSRWGAFPVGFVALHRHPRRPDRPLPGICPIGHAGTNGSGGKKAMAAPPPSMPLPEIRGARYHDALAEHH